MCSKRFELHLCLKVADRSFAEPTLIWKKKHSDPTQVQIPGAAAIAHHGENALHSC